MSNEIEVVGIETHGDPTNLTWAVFEFATEAHAVPGKFSADVAPAWPNDHVRARSCPCRPIVNWHSMCAPRPLYEHRAQRSDA